ncbi:MAG TPA: homoserine dehydrogenase [Candidatus Brocadiia bacterium]|nr:homoserine dehydrogenase [Candidatus Brocadiales bacterium]
MAKEKTVKIGLLGSGTIGTGVQDIILKDSSSLYKKLGYRLSIEKIYTELPKERKWYSKYPEKFTEKPEDVLNADVDIIVEVLGLREPEKDAPLVKSLILKALENGKSVVTANKAVLARYGREIHEKAKERGVQVRYEASVAGGIPIIRALGEGLISDKITSIYGILNGTCNYILSGMNKNKTYREALEEAQKKGYAETNPDADVKGYDTRDKVIVLLQLVYGLFPSKSEILTEGIDMLERIDFSYAKEKLRYPGNIKLLGFIENNNREISARISPAIIRETHILSRVNGSYNAIFVESEYCEKACYMGRGAGAHPTANSIISDIISIADGKKHVGAGLKPAPTSLYMLRRDVNGKHRHYIRFLVKNQAGIVSNILGILFNYAERKREEIHVDEVLQIEHPNEERRYLKEAYKNKYEKLLVQSPPPSPPPHGGRVWDVVKKKYDSLAKCDVKDILPFAITLEPCKTDIIRNAIEEINKEAYILTEPLLLRMLWDLPDLQD